jgi:hypothetical protein
MAVESREGDNLVIRADLPGINPETAGQARTSVRAAYGEGALEGRVPLGTGVKVTSRAVPIARLACRFGPATGTSDREVP